MTQIQMQRNVKLKSNQYSIKIGRVDAYRPEDHGFKSRSSCHVGTLGKSFTHSCLWRFGVKL